MKLQRESNRLQLSRRFELHELLQWKHGGLGPTLAVRLFSFFWREKKQQVQVTLLITAYNEVKLIQNEYMRRANMRQQIIIVFEHPCSTNCFPWRSNIKLSDVTHKFSSQKHVGEKLFALWRFEDEQRPIKISQRIGLLMQVCSIFQRNIVTVQF